jgi:hypothetical protein
MEIKECPKCKSTKGYYFKNTGSYKEAHLFNICAPRDERFKDMHGSLKVSSLGKNAFCITCDRRLEELDRSPDMKEKKLEYYKVIADGKDQGIILKTHKQKVRTMKVLRGIKLVTATEEDIKRYNG